MAISCPKCKTLNQNTALHCGQCGELIIGRSMEAVDATKPRWGKWIIFAGAMLFVLLFLASLSNIADRHPVKPENPIRTTESIKPPNRAIPMPRSQERRPPAESGYRTVVVENDAERYTDVAVDVDAYVSVFEMIAQPSAAARVKVQDMRDQGRLFHLPNGTKAVVLSEIPISADPLISYIKIARIRLSDGPHEGRIVFCASTVLR